MPEDHKNMKKVQCWIPLDTWDKIVSLGYDSPTIAVTKAFEKLLEDPLNIPEISPKDPRVNPLVSLKDPLESPDIPVYKVKIEALEMVLAEKDRSIERLENDLNKAGQREEDLKQMHNNYMLQVQSLINARALMPAGSTKGDKPTPEKKESKYSPKEEKVYSEHEVKPEVNQEEKKGKQKACLYCGETFTAARSTRLFCSGRCKTAYGRKQKAS